MNIWWGYASLCKLIFKCCFLLDPWCNQRGLSLQRSHGSWTHINSCTQNLLPLAFVLSICAFRCCSIQL